jgi:phospholipid/cholesterol/gamma-HCH transport system substrate-binding protein
MTARRLVGVGGVIAVTLTGCAFQGVNSLPLPGVVGRGADATTYRVEIANVGTLEPNSPVLIDDVVVGSVKSMVVNNWHANVEVSVQRGVSVPANAVVTVGQTSLLGSMHLALNPPLGQPPAGTLPAGATIPLNRASTYPSTEQTLASLSVLINTGGVTQIGDIIHNTNEVLQGRGGQIRDVLTRLNTFIGTLDQQRDNIIGAIDGLDRLTGKLAAQIDTIAAALHQIPPALEVLIRERPRLTTALDKLRAFSDIATGLINDSQRDLITNLTNLAPTLSALADIGPKLDTVLALAPTFPFPQNVVDRGVRGDYLNLYAIIDLTHARLKRTLFRGTRWADITADLVAAPGEPNRSGSYMEYTYDPLAAPLAPPPSPVVGPAPPQPTDTTTPPSSGEG